MVGTRTARNLEEWLQAKGQGAQVGTFAETAAFGDILVLAVKGTIAKDALALAGPENISGKVMIDPTNPIADAPPEDGVLPFFTDQNGSLMESLQEAYPDVRFVKAFSSVGNPGMVNPSFEVKPSMFICGNDSDAKSDVREILDQFGWETEDCGGVKAARAIEPLCMLWCIPFFLNEEYGHAFKLLR